MALDPSFACGVRLRYVHVTFCEHTVRSPFDGQFIHQRLGCRRTVFDRQAASNTTKGKALESTLSCVF